MEGGIHVRLGRRIRPRGTPSAEVDVAKDNRELALRHRHGPAVLRPAERQVLALAVCAEARREAGLAWRRDHYLSSCGARHRLPFRVCGCPLSMEAGSAQDARTTFGLWRGSRKIAEVARAARSWIGASWHCRRRRPAARHRRARLRQTEDAAAVRPSPCDQRAGGDAGAGGIPPALCLRACWPLLAAPRHAPAKSQAGVEGPSRVGRRRARRVFVDPRPRLPVEPSDLSGVDEGFGLGAREAQPSGKPVGG